MLSSVLRSKRAIRVNIAIMRAFIQLRDLVSSNKELKEKIEEMEKKYDRQFQVVFDAIRKLVDTTQPAVGIQRKIGFKAE